MGAIRAVLSSARDKRLWFPDGQFVRRHYGGVGWRWGAVAAGTLVPCMALATVLHRPLLGPLAGFVLLVAWSYVDALRALIGCRTSLIVADEGLIERFAFRPPRLHPWPSIRGVAPDASGLVTDDGHISVGALVRKAPLLIAAAMARAAESAPLAAASAASRPAPDQPATLVLGRQVPTRQIQWLAGGAGLLFGVIGLLSISVKPVSLVAMIAGSLFAYRAISLGRAKPETGGLGFRFDVSPTSLRIAGQGKRADLNWSEVWGAFFDLGYMVIRTSGEDYLCVDGSPEANSFATLVNRHARGLLRFQGVAPTAEAGDAEGRLDCRHNLCERNVLPDAGQATAP